MCNDYEHRVYCLMSMVPDQIVLYAKIENWPTTYSRVSINVKTADQVMFLEHGSAMRLGHRFIRQGDAVTLARGRWKYTHSQQKAIGQLEAV